MGRLFSLMTKYKFGGTLRTASPTSPIIPCLFVGVAVPCDPSFGFVRSLRSRPHSGGSRLFDIHKNLITHESHTALYPIF